MKHILNNLSEEEKNAIREQHAGGMKVMTENFSKLVNTKLGDSKPLVSEQSEIQIDPKDLEMPNEDKLKRIFTGQDEMSDNMKQTGIDFQKTMKACISERNLYKVGGMFDKMETKQSNLFNTIVAMLFDSKMGGKSIGQEFNEFRDCVKDKMGNKMYKFFD